MKWKGNRESSNVEDRRGNGLPIGGKLGIGSVVIALVASLFFGVDPSTVLSIINGGGPPSQAQSSSGQPPANDETARFVSTVLADTEDSWDKIFRDSGSTYQPPKLVLFSGQTPSACGTGTAASGPFYCPGDRKVYIDLTFFRLMQEKFRVSGEFAQAYVIAHEVGHHVQNMMGVMERVDKARRSSSEAQANALSTRVELQADCFAGVWARNADQARGILEAGDVEAALNAAAAIGDDALQRRSQGYVVPDSFTHGTSAQRVRWFKRGIESGKVSACNTFGTAQP
ncbi:neutral zinc metallopeptidase [Lacisediminimonas sp.]|uniref:KPN_02809 family neutral zinc metallopeptidase n=1 Tax=Lacisediminimonas sp. TaxID=3060582 RepID=UPI00271FDC8C|nr:neutral zinc metallopeptidase [Lacisediminimonas sp.]MDO8301415.1 neutral zinc metallopeptidase [Lacisediminimonas sp.]